MFRGTIDLALAAIKALLIVNGGAAVALLALIGSIWGKIRHRAQASRYRLLLRWKGSVSDLAPGC